jgi:hypothetical protein
MNRETLVVGQRLLLALLVDLEHLAEGFEHVPALGGEVLGFVDDVAATVTFIRSS